MTSSPQSTRSPDRTPMSSRLRNTASMLMTPATRFAVAAALVLIVVSLVDVRTVWLHLRAFDPGVGCAMLAVNAILVALFAARWHAVARSVGIDAPYGRFFRGTWLGAFFSQLGPALILNEITRFRLLMSYAGKWPLGTSQVLDRISGQIVLAGIVLVLTPWYVTLLTRELTLRILLVTGVVAVLGTVVLALVHRFRRFIRVRAGAVRTVLNPVLSPTHYACSLAIQVLLIVNLWLAARGLGAAGHDIELLLIAPLILASLTILPISIADWGSREGAALLFLSATGLTPEQIVAISVIYGGVNLVSALPAALLLVPGAARVEADKGV